MIPVSSLSEVVNVVWFKIERYGYSVYGFMLYTDLDRVLVSYMADGLVELDHISGSECAIFVIESPSSKWIEHARKRDHPWSRLYDEYERVAADDGQKTEYSESEAVVLNNVIDNLVLDLPSGNKTPLKSLIRPGVAPVFDRDEAWEVMRHFNMKPNQVPSIVFFYDLYDDDVFVLDIPAVATERELTDFFRDFFSGEDFVNLCERRLQ